MQFLRPDRVGVRRDDEGMVDVGAVDLAEADFLDLVPRRDAPVNRAGEITVRAKRGDPGERAPVILI